MHECLFPYALTEESRTCFVSLWLDWDIYYAVESFLYFWNLWHCQPHTSTSCDFDSGSNRSSDKKLVHYRSDEATRAIICLVTIKVGMLIQFDARQRWTCPDTCRSRFQKCLDIVDDFKARKYGCLWSTEQWDGFLHDIHHSVLSENRELDVSCRIDASMTRGSLVS